MLCKSRVLPRPLQTVLVLVFASLSMGCGSRGTVSGKVYYRGKLLTTGTVTFVPQAGGEVGARTARISADGSYRVDKVPVGPVKIAVISYSGPAATLPRSRVSDMRSAEPPKGAPPEMKDILPRKQTTADASVPQQYADPDKSGVTYTVKSGAQEFDIEIK